jgi:hypothetical protein
VKKSQAIKEAEKVRDEINDCCQSCHEDQDFGYAPIGECWPACCCTVLKALEKKFPYVDFNAID